MLQLCAIQATGNAVVDFFGRPLLAYLVGTLSVVALYVIAKAATGGTIRKLCDGADGRPSTSKFQFFLWTAIVLFSFTALLAIKFTSSDSNKWEPLQANLPSNVLIVLGISVASAGSAKAITTSYSKTGRIQKKGVAPSKGRFADVFADDDGQPDLSKIQVIAWTFVAIVAYLITVCHHISATDLTTIPDIDKSLIALMGLGHAAYLGNKAVENVTPAGAKVQTEPDGKAPDRPEGATGAAAGQNQ
ncbi:MAG TPA: hypothetical protein VKY85_27065 [Candidatus Angelobacter sp.]|nr:hypothetical protein [Candidatus Angelobacter sp.]